MRRVDSPCCSLLHPTGSGGQNDETGRPAPGDSWTGHRTRAVVGLLTPTGITVMAYTVSDRG